MNRINRIGIPKRTNFLFRKEMDPLESKLLGTKKPHIKKYKPILNDENVKIMNSKKGILTVADGI